MQSCDVFETRLSNFHNLKATVSKQHFLHKNTKIIEYRSNKHFYHDDFRKKLNRTLPESDLSNMKQNVLNILINFKDIFA